MPEILPNAEITRITRKSTPSTRSSSPGPSPSYSTSPAVQSGALSPPPPTHYLRNKSGSEDGSEKSIKLLRKRSEIYDRDRERSRRSVAIRVSPRRSAPDGLLFQQDHLIQSSYLESPIVRGIIRPQDGISASPPMLSPSRQWAFLDTDPMSPAPASTTKPQFTRERDGSLLNYTRSPLSNDGSPNQPSRSLGGSVDSHSLHSHGSRRGSFPERDITSAASAAIPHSLSLNRFHHGRSAGSDSSISVSLSSHASSSVFPHSLDPCSKYSPPVQSAVLPPSGSSALQISTNTASSHDPESISPVTFAQPHSPHSAPALFEVQKRRRASAFDHFTSYTESLPYHNRSAKHSKRHLSGTQDHADILSGSQADAASLTESRTLHSTRSVPEFGEHSWKKESVETSEDEAMDAENISPGQADSNAPRRKSSCRVMSGLKSMLTSKPAAQTKR